MSLRQRVSLITLITLAMSLSACHSNEQDLKPTEGVMTQDSNNGWFGDLPLGFPVPNVPIDQQMTAEKIELGRHLFYDPRLSGNQTQSCASCHEQAKAFSDGESQSTGSTGELTPRNSMSLTNVAYSSTYTWANPTLDRLESQIVIPLFGERPVEMGLSGFEDEVLVRLIEDETYQTLFANAYPQTDEPVSIHHVVESIASFVRTLISGQSPFDDFVYRQKIDALDESARRGMDLFFSERLECHHCHGGFNFSFSTVHQNSSITEVGFHNTGLYNLDNNGGYPMGSYGVYEVTGDPQDMGKFKAPTLRNIALTSPYMHDGSMTNLDEVIRFYEAGGRLITEGLFAGDGRENPLKSDFISGFTLSDQERLDLIQFLNALTDETFINHPKFSDPWMGSSQKK